MKFDTMKFSIALITFAIKFALIIWLYGYFAPAFNLPEFTALELLGLWALVRLFVIKGGD